ncbi:MAG: SelB C-terminal domain-containing protein, partial [Myxococcota bacterium]
IGSALRFGDSVELQPSGEAGRIRGLQSFGEVCEQVEPGARCAVNVRNVALAELGRGVLVTKPGAVPQTLVFDAELAWLPSAPTLGRDPTSVELLCGTAERRARVARIGAETDSAGERLLVRIHVDGEALPLLPDDRFVLRGFHRGAGAGATLGGGRVLDVAPPKRRRSDPALVAELRVLARGDTAEGLRARVTRGGFAGASTQELALETGRPTAEVEALLQGHDEGVVRIPPSRWLGADAAAELEARLLRALSAFHDAQPLEPGMPRATLRGALPTNVPAGAFEALIDRLTAAGRVELQEKLVCASDFVPRLSQREEAIAARLRADAMIAGLEPPNLADWSSELGVGEEELRPVLGHLERDGSLIRAPGELWFDRVAVDELRDKVVAHLTEHGELPTAAYKDLIGTSRKWAVPLMELFDAEHLTMRSGEARVLRRRPRAT